MVAQTNIARPYAKAAFEYAVEHQQLPVWSELLQMAALAVSYSDVRAFIMNPRVTAEQTCKLIIEICDKKLTSELHNFLQLLAENQRILVLPEIAYLFELYRAERERTVKVQITSAFPLSKEQSNKTIKALEAKLQRKVNVDWEIDKSLLGGMVIRATDLDWVLDGSAKGKLDRLLNELKGS